MEHDRNGLEVLDRDECLQLLSGCSLGRVAVSVGALPVILPVNFLLDRERILIRTGPGTKLDAATRDSVVAFEVDHIDPFSHGGLERVRHRDGSGGEGRGGARARRQELPLPHWTPNGVGHIMAVSIEIVSGRRIPRAATAAL